MAEASVSDPSARRSRSDSSLPTASETADGADGEGYAVYILTPNMWEEPWVRELLADLPTSRYEILDLWSPPPARPRIGRLAIRLESLLPGPLRPTRRMLRRVVDPHEHSVFVYNTWGLDRAVREELATLLSRFANVGIVSVDEPLRESKPTYDRVAFAVRVGFGAEELAEARNLIVTPLGVPKNFVPAKSPKSIAERRYTWAFLGEVKNTRRSDMVFRLASVRGESFLHGTSDWDSQDALRGSAYSDVLADSIFAPSPPANVHLECYRTYEALECQAIPVVDTDYYRAQFSAPFPVVRPSWDDAPELLNRLLDDPSSLRRLHDECRTWWLDVKRNYPKRIRELADRTRAAG